jgi:integrase
MYRTNTALKGVNKSTRVGKVTIEITFQIGTSRERIYIPTGEKLPVEFWTNGTISKAYPSSKEVSKRVSVIHNEIKALLFDLERKNGFVTKNLFNEAYFGKGETDQDLLVLLEKFIQIKDLSAKKKLIEKLRAIRNQLKAFLNGRKLYLNEVNQEFVNALTKYWVEVVGLQPNTIAKNFGFFRQFMNYLKNEEVLTSSKYQRLDYPSEVETNTVVLTRSEVLALDTFEPRTEHQKKIKDLFLIMIYSGLRFGDAVRINPSWVRGDFLFINTQKTGEKVSVPLHPKLKEVLVPIRFDVSSIQMTNQRFNASVKELCEQAGINQFVEIVKFERGKKKYLVYPKFKLIASHTGRRTFITNSILAGIPLPVIQKITGHKKLTTLQKYVDIADDSKKAEFEKLSQYFSL